MEERTTFKHIDGSTSINDTIEDGYKLCDHCTADYHCAKNKQCGILSVRIVKETPKCKTCIHYTQGSCDNLRSNLDFEYYSMGDAGVQEVYVKEDFGCILHEPIVNQNLKGWKNY